MNARAKRLQTVGAYIESLPIAPRVLDAAFELFCKTGELPDDQRCAIPVIERAVKAAKARKPQPDMQTALRNLARLLREIEAGELPPHPESVRDQLFHEAVHESGFVRMAARTALRQLVCQGKDVLDSQFPGDGQMPDYGTVGLHLIGFPHNLAKPPHENQTQSLLDRFAALREHSADRDDAWFAELAAAGMRFAAEGAVPDDESMREAVLANAELQGCIKRLCGEAGEGAVLNALLLKALAGDVRAARLLFTRVGQAPACTKADAEVGPPVPRGQALIDYGKGLLRVAAELGIAIEEPVPSGRGPAP